MQLVTASDTAVLISFSSSRLGSSWAAKQLAYADKQAAAAEKAAQARQKAAQGAAKDKQKKRASSLARGRGEKRGRTAPGTARRDEIN